MKTVLLANFFLASITFSTEAQSLSWMHFNANNSPLPSNTIHDILAVENGTWVGTDAGLAFYNGSDWTVYTSETSDLPDNHIRDIYEDNWGNTWIATDEGILRITENNWEVFNVSNSGLTMNTVRSVTTDSEGNLWVGTWGGGIAKKIGTEWTTYNTSNSDIPSDGIFTIELDPLGNVWVGTFNGGAAVFDGVHWEIFNTSNSEIPHNHVRSITFDSNGITWFGTDDGIAKRNASNQWFFLNYQVLGFSFHVVFDGVQESAGKVFFGTDGGMISFNQTDFNVQTAQNSNLPSNNIRCISEDEDGNLWMGTGNDGVSIYSPQGSLDVNELRNDSELLSLYPNPTEGEIMFNLDEIINDNLGIEVRNTLGQTILTQNVTHTSGQQHALRVDDLTPGIYHLTVQSSNTLSTKTFYKL
ncbi:MAG: T9SS type A sorting domain-containing protein [Flavobacteriales bacterium]|nr:T9SS type A sorting domain-containing protein [Flavobacteriales bacterium]